MKSIRFEYIRSCRSTELCYSIYWWHVPVVKRIKTSDRSQFWSIECFFSLWNHKTRLSLKFLFYPHEYLTAWFDAIVLDGMRKENNCIVDPWLQNEITVTIWMNSFRLQSNLHIFTHIFKFSTRISLWIFSHQDKLMSTDTPATSQAFLISYKHQYIYYSYRFNWVSFV
jgi:hypothetical protein